MTLKRLSLVALTLCLGLTAGCSSVLTATRDTPIEDDRGTRTFGSKIDDSLIETKVAVNVAKANLQLQRHRIAGWPDPSRRPQGPGRASRSRCAASEEGQQRTSSHGTVFDPCTQQ